MQFLNLTQGLTQFIIETDDFGGGFRIKHKVCDDYVRNDVDQTSFLDSDLAEILDVIAAHLTIGNMCKTIIKD